jgi:hypothetical protein
MQRDISNSTTVKLISYPKGRIQIQMFDKTVLSVISELRTDEVTQGWRKLHNEVFHNLYSLQNIITVAKSTGWDG